MVTLRHLHLTGVLFLVGVLLGCDESSPTSPTEARGGPPPTLSATAVSYEQINLAWQDNSTNETGWEVHRSTTGAAGPFSLLAQLGANSSAYTDGGLQGNTQYCYTVRWFRTTGRRTSYSAFSDIACVTTPMPPPPSAPTGANATPSGSSAVWFTWSDASWDEAGFRVQRSIDQLVTWGDAGTVGPNETWFLDGDRTSEQEVCYRVVAFGAGGDSDPSNVDCTTPPAAPTNLTMTPVDEFTVELGWTDNSAVEEGYELWLYFEYCDDGGYDYYCWPYYYSVWLPPNSTSWSMSASESFYSLAALKDGGYSDWLYATGAGAFATAASGSLRTGRNDLRNGR
jgi:hypothetical protein